MVQGQWEGDHCGHLAAVFAAVRGVDRLLGPCLREHSAAGRQLANAVNGRSQGSAGDVQSLLGSG